MGLSTITGRSPRAFIHLIVRSNQTKRLGLSATAGCGGCAVIAASILSTSRRSLLAASGRLDGWAIEPSGLYGSLVRQLVCRQLRRLRREASVAARGM